MGSFRTLQQVMSHHIPEARNFSVVLNIKVRTTDSSRMLQYGMWHDISEERKFMHLGIFLTACCTNWPYRNFSPITERMSLRNVRWLCSQMSCHINALKEPASSIFCHENGGSRFPRNLNRYYYITQHQFRRL
jgi:hypothetical protein